MNPRTRSLLTAFLVGLVVIVPTVFENWYGRTYYADDAISYLDVSKAITRGDWALALNSYWSIGYPVIIAATRWMFPAGPWGEWTAIHVVNLVLFVGIYLSFLYFLKVATIFTAKVNGAADAEAGEGWNGFPLAIGTAIFLLWQLQIGNASRVSPDPLISGFFFLVAATALNFYLRPAIKTAVLLGLLMGVGYLLKAVFLPVSCSVLVVMFAHTLLRPSADRLPTLFKLVWAPCVLALVALPYVMALSKVVGTFTLGQSGSLNYAWNVNHMPRSTNWEGGPDPFGAPIHPTHLVLKNPPVFVFDQPFPVTYPPWFNPPYWYDGYHHFFSVRNQAEAFVLDVATLRRFFFEGQHVGIKVFVFTALLAAGLILLQERPIWWKRLVALWPLYLLPTGAICVYLLVVIEPRYVVGFLIVLLVTPFLPLFAPTPLVSRRAAFIVAAIVAVSSAVILLENKSDIFYRAVHGESYATDVAWKLGLYLNQLGIEPGDKVASVNSGSSIDCTWAYVAGVQVVAEIGNDAYDLDSQDRDLEYFAQNPDVQQSVFACFEQAGVRLVVVRNHPAPLNGPGWVRIPGTEFWIHFLSANKNIDKG